MSPVTHHGVPWFENATGAALAQAEASEKLVFVDLWAPWCHTCLSMREYVLTAEHLAAVRDRLVFLAVDTERAENASTLARLPLSAWPTFYLIDSRFKVYGRWVGAASPAQLALFVRDGLRGFEASAGRPLSGDEPLRLALEGDRSFSAGDYLGARTHYEQALSKAPASWPRRPDVLLAWLTTQRKLDANQECVELALTALDQTGRAATTTDFSYGALECARKLATRDPRVKRLNARIDARLFELCKNGSPEMSPDDRSDACGLVRTLRKDAKNRAGERQVLALRLEILRHAAQGLPDSVAVGYDSALSESLVGLGRGEEAVELLRAREAALPSDYTPSQLLARTLRDLGRYDEALPAVESALAKSQGVPRRASILGIKADVLLALGRRSEAKAVLTEQLATYRALPVGQQQPAREVQVAQKLSQLE